MGGPVPDVLRRVVAVLADVDAYVPALSLGKLGRFAIGEGDLVVLVDAPVVRLHSLFYFRVFAHLRANFDERIAEEAARFRRRRIAEALFLFAQLREICLARGDVFRADRRVFLPRREPDLEIADALRERQD